MPETVLSTVFTGGVEDKVVKLFPLVAQGSRAYLFTVDAAGETPDMTAISRAALLQTFEESPQ